MDFGLEHFFTWSLSASIYRMKSIFLVITIYLSKNLAAIGCAGLENLHLLANRKLSIHVGTSASFNGFWD